MAEQPQGTEYTLQGVMRFLQMEWHNHERARNAWDIERAEMKAKIAKQEGDCRSAKKLIDSLDRQIKMLERALKHERAKNKAIAAGEKIPTEEEMRKEWNGKIGIKPNPIADSLSPTLGASDAAANHQEHMMEKEGQRDKSKAFLQKCIEELTYLLTPPAHPLSPEAYPQGPINPELAPPHEIRPSAEEAFAQQQKRYQAGGQPHLPSLPNHHQLQQAVPPEAQNASKTAQQPQAAMMTRSVSMAPPPPHQPRSRPEENANPSQAPPAESYETVEHITHTFDQHGRPVPNAEEPSVSQALINNDDGWNFDDATLPPESNSELAPVQRPDNDLFPSANALPAKPLPRTGLSSHRRKSSGGVSAARRRSDGAHELRDLSSTAKGEPAQFKVRFALGGHLDVVRSVIFTGGGSPSEPEICTTGDDGMIKRWIIPSTYGNFGNNSQPQHNKDLDIQAYFTHRGHEGAVTCLAACLATPPFATGGRISGDGWIFSGGQDATVRVWERGRVDSKATLEGHTDAIWALCVLPATAASVFDHVEPGSPVGSGDRILLVSGSADNTIKIWAVSAPPQLNSPQTAPSGSRRGVGGGRRHSITGGSGFPSSPQPSIASNTPFHYTLVHTIEWPRGAASSPTSISPLGQLGESFVVSYADSNVLIFDTKTGEEIVGMASQETYDGTPATAINSVVVTSSNTNAGSESNSSAMGLEAGRSEEEAVPHGATGSSKAGGVEGVIITGHEDRYVRFFDANSGQCTYSMLAHPASIASLSLSPDGRELVSGGHDASLRFWSLEKRSCVQEITSHRMCRGEGVVSVIWSHDGRWVVSGGGDGVIKVFSR